MKAVRAEKGAFLWWRAQKVERPLVRGAVFWASDVPAKTWYVECRDQAGHWVCVDQYAGQAEAHR